MIQIEHTPNQCHIHAPGTDAAIINNIKFFILNLLPPGLYALYRDLKNTHKINELEKLIKGHKITVEVRNGKWAKIESRMKTFREDPELGIDCGAMKSVVEQAGFLEKITYSNNKTLPLDYSSRVFRFILNCISFGLSALSYNQTQLRKIALLTRELAHFKNLASDTVQEKKIKQFQNELDLLDHEIKLKHQIQRLKSFENNPKALVDFVETEKRKDSDLRNRKAVIIDEHRNLQDQKIVALKQLAHVNDEKKSIEDSTKKLQQDLTNLECNIKKTQELLKKKNEEIVNANEQAKMIIMANKEKDEIIFALNLVHATSTLHQQLNAHNPAKELIKLSYDIPGAFDKLDIELNDTEKNYKKIAKDKRSALELTRAFFSYFFAKQKHFTDKNTSISQKKYVFRLIAFNFIYGGSLEQSCQGYSLRLNQHGVSFSYSHPVWAQSLRIKDGRKEPYLGIYPTVLDEFTTEIAIHPEIIKSIINKLNHSEVIYLKNLLKIEQLSKLSSPSKISKEKVELIEEAYSHLALMGESLEKKFGSAVGY